MGDHSETIEIEYDPAKTDFKKLLNFFWKGHDPTRNCSRQYMSVIFYFDKMQKEEAEKSLILQQKNQSQAIKTKILPAKEFYPAENYHQKYLLQRHPFICNALGIEPGEEMIHSHVAARLNGYLGGYGPMSQFNEEWPQLGITEKIANYIQKQIFRKSSR